MYIFLKNRSLQIFYRQGVAVLAVVFAVIIYLMGMFTRFRSTFYTYAAIQDVTADYVTDTTYVNIRNPYNRPYQVELDPSYSVLPITRRSISASVGEAKFTGKESYQIAIERGEERLTIRGQDIPAFSPRYFKLERKQENTDNIGIAGNVDYFEGSISGEVTNHFPFPLENATLMLYGNMVLLGRLEEKLAERIVLALDYVERYQHEDGLFDLIPDWKRMPRNRYLCMRHIRKLRRRAEKTAMHQLYRLFFPVLAKKQMVFWKAPSGICQLCHQI